MPVNEYIGRSVLIVSSSERFDMLVKKTARGFETIDIRRSIAIARRCVLERDYDLIVVNCPMPDEMGVEFALDVAEKTSASLLLVVPAEIYNDVLEQVTDLGILAISKPVPSGRIDQAIRYLISVQNKVHKLIVKNRKLEEKMEELRLVSKAKIILVEKKKMTEDEAHSFIGRQAMNSGATRRTVAERILDEYD